MRKYLFCILLLLCLSSPAVLASETAWPLKKNSTYIEVDANYFSYSDNLSGRIFGYALNNRVEVGILETSSIFFRLPFQTLSRFDTFENNTQVFTNNGLTDIHLGNLYQFLNDPVSLSLKTALKIPTGYDPGALPSIGNQQLDLEAQLLSGYILPWFPGYIQGGLGYRLRSHFDPQHAIVLAAAQQGNTLAKPSDQVLGLLEAGVWLLPELFVALEFQAQWGIPQAEAQTQSLLSLRPMVAYRLNPYVDLSLQYQQAIWSLNQPHLTGISLGSHYRFGLPLAKDLGPRGGKAEHATTDPNFD